MQTDRRDFPRASTGLLVAGEPPPAVVENPGGGSAFVLIGDHAGRAIPRRLGDLGLTPAQMDRHIAWDIGVAGLGRRLAVDLDACFVRQTYSRLIIDCNRALGAEGSVAATSDGVAIPGNQGLTPGELEARAAEIYRPYHQAIAALLDDRRARSQPTVLVSLHSFTPVMAGFVRPWRFGVLHRDDSAFSRAMLAVLRAEVGEAAGENEPYRMDEIDYTIPFHADARGLDYLELEVRQDLLADAAGQAAVADRIGPALIEALGRLGQR